MNILGYRLVQEELLSNVTLNFTNAMSIAEMQARLDQIPRYLRADLTVQFADGTYVPEEDRKSVV